ncbi:MAG: Na+/H+ antiporter subunit D [Bacillota bacterium]|nr:Na+/H+ antiporter subunit D [Bacillota bacterium]
MAASTNWVLSPQLIPWLTAILLIFTYRQLKLQRWLSAISVLLALANAIHLLALVRAEGVLVFWASNWVPPFGIIMVADTLSAIMVLMSAIIGAVVVFYSFRTIDEGRERHFYYFLIQMLLVGCNGAFITGDIFNLYVWFEILLLSSYVLLVLGSERGQLRETYKYVLLNVLASTFFLVGLGLLYGVAGTLNMADLAVKLPQVENQGLVTLIAVIFIVVFGSKAAIFPLYFWLPQSYTEPPAAVSALFGGLLTKVGVYCLIRTFTLIFVGDTEFTHTLLLILGIATMVFGGLGAIAQYNYKRILSYHIISQVGYMLMGLALNSVVSIAAAIYFMVHNIVVKSSLFLFAGVTEKITGTNELKQMGGLLHRYPWLGWGFFLGGISLAGVPPFSGFFAKYLMLQGAADISSYVAMFFTLAVGFLTLFSMMKIFIYCYWGAEKPVLAKAREINYLKMLPPALALVCLSIAMGVCAEAVIDLIMTAAAQLKDPSIYITAVLG